MGDGIKKFSLHGLFDDASAGADAIISESVPSTEAACEQVLVKLDRCAALVEELCIFGNNESFEDIQTPHINYLLVPYYQGAITLLLNKSPRLPVLEEASMHFNRFINLVEDYGLAERMMYTENPSCDPYSLRNKKIEEYRRIREMNDRESLLKKRILSAEDNCDEELYRDYYKLKVELSKAKAASELQMISREVQIIKMRRDTEEEEKESSPVENAPTVRRDASTSHLTILASDQNNIKSKVFTSGLSQPTMTVEQFIESQINIIGKPPKGGADPKKEDSDECDGDYELADAKVMSQRRWDEYKDTSPCGWGNRYNRG